MFGNACDAIKRAEKPAMIASMIMIFVVFGVNFS